MHLTTVQEGIIVEITKIKAKYEKRLIRLEQDIAEYESSNNQELKIASRTLKAESEELRTMVEALTKQIPMKAYYEYDDEFTCPACSFEDDGYDVKTLNVCPKCGQKLRWD